jgi:Fuc2NAc and GlcNAc transferase
MSFMTGMFGAWFIYRFGRVMGVVDVPNERSSHDKIIPKGGGIGILVVFIICSLNLEMPKMFWVCGVFIALVSFAGDKLEIVPRVRLVVQLGGAFLFLAGLIWNHHEPVYIFFLIIPLMVYIAGTANFYNFMDGINGIAGITGVVGFLLVAYYGIMVGAETPYVTFSIAIACACGGFLPFNIPHAKVFMGDVGSVLLGYAFACMVILMSQSFFDFVCLSAFLFPFYVDELTTMVLRFKNGESLTKAHRKHIYQIIANEYGVTHWKVSVAYGVAQLFTGLGVIILMPYGLTRVITFLFTIFISFVVFSLFVRRNAFSKVRK